MSFYAGGEYLCLVVCEALQEAGYNVCLATQDFDPHTVQRIYGLGEVMRQCEWIEIPRFNARGSPLRTVQRIVLARQLWHMFRDNELDIGISTQSSPFILNQRLYHFVYNADDVFNYPRFAAPLDRRSQKKWPQAGYYATLRQAKKMLWERDGPHNDWFFAVGTGVLEGLRARRYRNSSLTFPPCRTSFSPKYPKQRRVVQFARIIPDKRLEVYSELASRLPDQEFILVGKRDQLTDSLYPRYADSIISELPKNVTYIDATTRERPDLLEDSQVCIYTGQERGIILSIIEAMSAGCIPFAPAGTGGADVLKAAQVGVAYRNVDEAVVQLHKHLDIETPHQTIIEISNRARKFGPGPFKDWIKAVASLDKSSTVPDYWPA
jgi:glycosyltransferase involved in cell wall biosynthesis